MILLSQGGKRYRGSGKVYMLYFGIEKRRWYKNRFHLTLVTLFYTYIYKFQCQWHLACSPLAKAREQQRVSEVRGNEEAVEHGGGCFIFLKLHACCTLPTGVEEHSQVLLRLRGGFGQIAKRGGNFGWLGDEVSS